MPELRTEIRLSQVQKLAITQTLRQQLEILQMSSFELDGLIATELSENPLLEVKDDAPEKQQEKETQSEEPEREDSEEQDPLDLLKEIDESIGTAPSTRFREEEQWHPEAASPETLSGFLLSQLDGLEVSSELENAVVYVIYSLDRNGLLSMDFTELAAGWDGELEIMTRAVGIVQNFDPAGVAQFSARKALLFQLSGKLGESAAESLEYKIIDRCFPELAERRVLSIAATLAVAPHEVEVAIQKIQELNPWPGSEFAGSSGTVVIPDVIIERHDGKFMVFLNDNRFPHLSISSRNRRLLESPSTETVEKNYVKKKFKRASWFIKAIKQRQETVMKIAYFIVETQMEFLLHGIESLRPLTLQEAAKALGFNQSTISRAINGKYVQSPQGIHEMRYYFSRGSADASVTAISVKEEITRIVNREDKAKPLSDERIADILNSGGTAIKRRTVANYRKQMNIPGARKRRRF
ncbi:MAG: RNA polymerase factor sigma-54 [Candidatus Fermentibacteraceae bacterium]|nr:RNA polymerase factor sigma-54 [Candidatus Fermentibacteraceae bacterium]